MHNRNTLKIVARRLRHDMTDAERLLWERLRRKQILGVQFYRQRPIGGFVADFAATSIRLIVEVDGSQHRTPAGLAKDRERTARLEGLGYCVLRFDNRRVLTETNAVVADILTVVRARKESPSIPL